MAKRNAAPRKMRWKKDGRDWVLRRRVPRFDWTWEIRFVPHPDADNVWNTETNVPSGWAPQNIMFLGPAKKLAEEVMQRDLDQYSKSDAWKAFKVSADTMKYQARERSKKEKKRNRSKPKTRIPTPHKGSLGGPGYTSKTVAQRHRILSKHVKDFGYASTISSLQSRINLGSRTMGAKALAAFRADKKWVQDKFGAKRNMSVTAYSSPGRHTLVKYKGRMIYSNGNGALVYHGMDDGLHAFTVLEDSEGDLINVGTYEAARPSAVKAQIIGDFEDMGELTPMEKQGLRSSIDNVTKPTRRNSDASGTKKAKSHRGKSTKKRNRGGLKALFD